MQSSRASSKSLEKQQFSSYRSKINEQTSLKQSKQLKKRQNEKRNPQDQQEQLKQIVKQYIRGKNIEQLKKKFLNERLIKKRNRGSIDLRKSIDAKKLRQSQQKQPNTSRPHHNSVVKNLSNVFMNSDHSKYAKIVEQFHEQCDKYKECTCGAHHYDTNQIKIKIKDPVSKFQSNYTIGTRLTKMKSKSLIQRPQITASHLSSQLQNVPQYAPKFDTVDLDSSYKAQFVNAVPRDKLDSFKNLKLSSVKFGPKEVKEFQSSYQKQYRHDNDDKYAAKSPQPFVVKQPQNLNAFGMKYHSINSSYQKEFEAKNNVRRDNLKPPSLFKDLNIFLIKDSSYKQAYSPRKQQVKTSRRNRLNKEKIAVVHHLSSSFIPLDKVQIDSQLLDSSYKKDYVKESDYLKYHCPHGVKSSNGAISKY